VSATVTNKTMPTVDGGAQTLRLVLGDQLNPLHPWFAQVDPGVLYVLMEVRQETDYVRHHAQKVLAIFAAMRAFAAQMRAAGHRVIYLRIGDAANRQSIADNLLALLDSTGARCLQYQSPDEWRLARHLQVFCASNPLTERAKCTEIDSDHFYTQRGDAARLFAGKRSWLMETFYRHLRRKHRVLLDADGEPEGGQWNFDADNRKPWRGPPQHPAEPPDPRPCHDHSALWAEVQAAGIQTVGAAHADALRWPINRAESLALLEAFIQQALPFFGDYQDAMSTRATHLFHSLLSFSLNTKMLSPHEVVQAAEAAYRNGHAPLPAVEGFIRQILGWREYVRGFYWSHAPGHASANVFHHTLPLPDWFWSGQTRMACLAHAVGQTLDTAYAHHIQRLMVIGNFALLAGLDPAAVDAWYLGVYVDAFEWVQQPNTRGMSQWADGGLLATKPYVSSAAYIDRMSNYCKGCAYNNKLRLGEQACPFNALYWDFYLRHEALLARNPRIGMAYRQLAVMPQPERDAIRQRAQSLRANLNTL